MLSLSPRRRQPEQDLAFERITDRVRQQVAQHLFQEPRIAAHREPASNDAPAEAARGGVGGKVASEPIEQVVDPKIGGLRVNVSGFELIDVEQRIKHAGHAVERHHRLTE